MLIIIAILIGTAAAASVWDSVKTIVVGHTEDAINRAFGEDMIIDGQTFKFGDV